MFKNFSKIILIFSLSGALPIYAMKRNARNADFELLQIINSFVETVPSDTEDWENIIKCLENGANPNLKGKKDTTILHLACFGPKYNLETKKYLQHFLKHGANPDISNHQGLTPLIILLQFLKKNPECFDPEMLETLLQYNANPNLLIIGKIPNTEQSYSSLPLDYAIKSGSENCVKILLKYGANINAKSSYIRTQPHFFHDSVTPLIHAMLYYKLGIMGVLCREYASLENVSDYVETAFEYALKALKNPEPIIKNLIINTRFKLPTTGKELDLTALTLLLVFENPKFKFQIPEDLKFRILAMLPEAHNWKKPDSKLYKGLYAKNYKNPYIFARLIWHEENIRQIVNKKNKAGKTIYLLLAQNEKTKEIIPQLQKDIDIILQYSRQKILPDNLALQICNNYEELLKEEQAQNRK